MIPVNSHVLFLNLDVIWDISPQPQMMGDRSKYLLYFTIIKPMQDSEA